jgi:hypothetical protein
MSRRQRQILDRTRVHLHDIEQRLDELAAANEWPSSVVNVTEDGEDEQLGIPRVLERGTDEGGVVVAFPGVIEIGLTRRQAMELMVQLSAVI